MATYSPIAYTIPQYEKAKFKNWWLKAYTQGTTTPIVISYDSVGTTLASRVELNSEGFPETAGGDLFIPHISGDYDLWAFPTAAEADADDTTNAYQFADNINANPSSQDITLTNVSESKTLTSGQTVVVFSIDISGASFYISGVSADNGRLTVGDDYTVVVSTKTVTLTQSYPAGTKLIAVYNDAGAVAVDYQIYDTNAEMIASSPAAGLRVRTNGKNSEGDGGGREYLVKTSAAFNSVADESKMAFTLANGNIATLIESFDVDDSNVLEIIAHRGFRNQFPQNTMMAMSGALHSGADSLECDVSISATGTPYLFHDATVDALTNGSGTFTALADATINALIFDEVAGTAFADEYIPTFAEFLAFARKSGVMVYPEIKAYRTQADIALIVDAVEASGMEDKCVLQSFTYSDLEYVRTLNKRIYVGYLGSATSGYETTIDNLRGLGRALLLWDQTALVTQPLIVSYAKSNNVGVAAYTITQDYQARNLLEIGVNRLMSDVILSRVSR